MSTIREQYMYGRINPLPRLFIKLPNELYFKIEKRVPDIIKNRGILNAPKYLFRIGIAEKAICPYTTNSIVTPRAISIHSILVVLLSSCFIIV